MINAIQENLLAYYTHGGEGQASGGDAYNGLNDKDRFSNAVIDERPTRDPDVFGPKQPRAAAP